MAVLLASQSPQRRTLLRQLQVPFCVKAPHVDEIAEGDPLAVARANAELKACSAVNALARDPFLDVAQERAMRALVVVGCDTFVEHDDDIIGKPRSLDQAREMLVRLRGQTHRVTSGLCLIDGSQGDKQVITTDTAITHVTFRDFSDELLEMYLATGQWQGRAGGYAIQEQAAALVSTITGCYFNIVGFPVAAFFDRLDQSPQLKARVWERSPATT